MKLEQASRVVICRPDRIGDVIISTSCLPTLKKRFPDTKFYFMAREPLRILLQNHPCLSGFISIPPHAEDFSWKDVAMISMSLRQVRPTSIIHLHPHPTCYLAAWQQRIRLRVGYPRLGWTWTLNRTRPDNREQGLKHEALYNFDLLEELGVKPKGPIRPSIVLDVRYKDSLAAKLPQLFETMHYAVINPTAHSLSLRWPAEYFAELAKRIHHNYGMDIVLIGDRARDASISKMKRMLQSWSIPYINLAGKTHLGELAWLLRHAKVFVSRNTGSSHLAAAVNCPAVDIFGRTAPTYGPMRWRPLSPKSVILMRSPRRKKWETTEEYWHRCFRSISVDEVEEAVNYALRETPLLQAPQPHQTYVTTGSW
jgi:heptosyltransferase-2